MKRVLFAWLFGVYLGIAPVLATPEWKEPLLDSIEKCQEPLVLEQYSNEDFTVTLFIDPDMSATAQIVLCIKQGTTLKKVSATIVGQYENETVVFVKGKDSADTFTLGLAFNAKEPYFFFEISGNSHYNKLIDINPVFLRGN